MKNIIMVLLFLGLFISPLVFAQNIYNGQDDKTRAMQLRLNALQTNAVTIKGFKDYLSDSKKEGRCEFTAGGEGFNIKESNLSLKASIQCVEKWPIAMVFLNGSVYLTNTKGVMDSKDSIVNSIKEPSISGKSVLILAGIAKSLAGDTIYAQLNLKGGASNILWKKPNVSESDSDGENSIEYSGWIPFFEISALCTIGSMTDKFLCGAEFGWKQRCLTGDLGDDISKEFRSSSNMLETEETSFRHFSLTGFIKVKQFIPYARYSWGGNFLAAEGWSAGLNYEITLLELGEE